MKTLKPLMAFLFVIPNLFAQEIVKEKTFQFESLKRDCYLGEVTVNTEDETTSLHYVQKKLSGAIFYSYHFDENLKFLEETKVEETYEQEEYSLKEAIKKMGEDLKKIGQELKTSFQWFTNTYRGETYTEDRVHIYTGSGGKIAVQKYRYTYAYGWESGCYYPKTELIDELDIKGERAEHIYLYDWVQNNETGDAYLIVGLKADKKSKVKYQQARKFQIIKITSDFELEYGETINFSSNMAISFARVLTNETPEETYDLDPDIPLSEDISRGPLALVFSPIKSLLAKKQQSDYPERQTLVLLDENGKIDSKINFRAKISGWVIEDFILSADGRDFYLYGPAKEGDYVNQVMPVNSPLSGKTEIKEIKWKSFQLMKISNKELAWVKATDLKEFKDKAMTPPSQKQKPTYIGKKFEKTMTYVTPEGEVFIGGQKYTYKKQLTDRGSFQRVGVNYKDLVLFHFDARGNLKAQYGVRRDKMNSHSKAILTPQDLVLTEDGQSLVWIYGEIKGFRGGFEVATLDNGSVRTISKNKLLYYPAVSTINLDNGEVGDFKMLGQDAKGKQLYYAHPNFPYVLSPQGDHITFIGEDKRGTLVWLSKMKL